MIKKTLYPLIICVAVLFNFHASSDDDILAIKKEDLFKIHKDDAVMGCDNAPNIIIEYSSLGCPHCGEYYKNVFPRVKVSLIDTCKAKYVYRDFPTTRPALRGSLLARCVATQGGKSLIDSKKYFDLLQLLFSTQKSWAFNASYDENLTRIANISGISNEEIKSCLANNEISMAIVNNSFTATKVLNLKYAPTIIVNGEMIGVVSYEKIVAAILKTNF